VGSNRVAQACAELLGQELLRLAAQLADGRRRGAREALELRSAALPDEQVAGRELADVPKDRERRGDGVEGEEALEGVEVDLPAGKRPQLGRELEVASAGAVVEGLDPEAIAREHEAAPSRIPQGDGEHAAQARCEALALLLVQVDQHLRVRARREAMARPLELGAKLPVVVDLPVLDDVDGSVLVRERLIACLEVDDGEPARGQRDGSVDVRPVRIGAAVDERGAHGREASGVDGAGCVGNAADPAHLATLQATLAAF
jgi:hypothetical protein